LLKNLKEGNRLEDLRVEGRVVLKCVLKNRMRSCGLGIGKRVTFL
jgi:hypothetical protein